MGREGQAPTDRAQRVELVVAPEAAGTRLDRFLAEPLGSRAQAQVLIDAGQVLVDGQVRPKRHALSAGGRVSGLLVVAKSDAVHRALKALLSARRLRREYLALVEGRPSARSGTVDAPIGRDRRDRVLMSIDTDEPRPARTHFEIERLLPRSTLVRVVLETGRTHQIRVHMAAIGHPVCGDKTYGGAGRYGLARQFLHASRLAFEHPVTHEAVDVRSPLPGDLVAPLDRANKGEE